MVLINWFVMSVLLLFVDKQNKAFTLLIPAHFKYTTYKVEVRQNRKSYIAVIAEIQLVC